MVELEEFAVDFGAALIAETKFRAFGERCRHEKIVLPCDAPRALAIGSARRFHLQDAHIDSHLEHFPAVGAFGLADDGLAGNICPGLEQLVDRLGFARHASIVFRAAR